MNPRSYCFMTFYLTVFGLGCVACLNWIVDPFGQYGTGVFPTRVQASRAQKIDLLERLDQAPAGLILGSSRVLKMEPEYLEKRTGRNFFNAGVNHGRPKDFLAILRWYHQRWNTYPEMVILGIDSAALSEVAPLDARITTELRLANVVPESISMKDSMARYFELTSLKQAKVSLNSILKSIRRSITVDPHEFYAMDGRIVYRQREQEVREGTYDFASAMNYNKREFDQIYRSFQRLSTEEVAFLVEAVSKLHQHHTAIYTFVTPFHPELSATLSELENFHARERESRQLLALLGLRFGIHIADLGNLTSFGGDPNDFVDGIHPLEKNTRLMVDRLLETQGGSQYAVQ